MEYYGNALCISSAELSNGIMTADYIRKLSSRGQLTQVRRACYGNCALYVVESLPERFKAEVYRRYPDLKEKAESKPFVDTVEPDGAAMAFYADYVLADGRHLATDKQAEYANNCAVLNAFGTLLERGNSHRMRQGKRRIKLGEFWQKAAAALPRLSDKFPNGLPESPRRLHMKFDEYQREGYVCMISKKYQNNNAAKVADGEQEAFMTQLLAHHNNLDNVTVAGYYNAMARQMGWPEISASAVGVWREKLDLVTAAGRRGATNFRNEKSMQVKRRRPSAPFLMWTLDGWTVELLYQQTTTDKKGHHVTTYSNRLTLEVVLDPCCDYPIGYAIGTHETPALIAEALRNAAQHSKELTGEMLRADQIQCDHYGIKTMQELYLVMADKLTPARVKNAKAKVVEPYFGYLNKTYCKKFNNWSGYGVTTDPKRQPNSEALNLLRHSFPDEAGVRAQIEKMMAFERQSKREKFLAQYAKLPTKYKRPLSRENYLLYFGATTGQTNALEGCGLRPTLLGVKRDYDSFDLTFREHAGVKWQVRYDPADLGEVLAVNEDGTLRYMLKAKHVQPMALADRREGDAIALQAVRDYNERLEQHVTTRLAQSYEVVAGLLERANSPELEIQKRLLIVDSRGQHKNNRERARLTAQDIKAIEVETVDVPLTPQGAPASDKTDYSIF